jgi:transcription elongation GreA/GreB family factor
MTPEAWRALRAEERCLEDDLRRLAGERDDRDGNLVHLPARDPARRLATLRDVLAAAEPTDVEGRAILGRRVTIREDDGQLLTYALVIPGEGDPLNGWVSADSPLGAALLEARAGDQVHFSAPSGPRRVQVVAIE